VLAGGTGSRRGRLLALGKKAAERSKEEKEGYPENATPPL